MGRRAGVAHRGLLAALLALGSLLLLPLPALLPATTAAAAAGPVALTITGMSPQWAGPGSVITVTGTVSNTSHSPLSGLTVQLFGSSTPVISSSDIRPGSAQQAGPAVGSLAGAAWQAAGPLPAGASATWSVKVPASTIGVRVFGVYPLAAQAQDSAGNPLAVSTTYLPYVPASTKSRPVAAPVAWVWPLIDNPLLDEPWQDDCSGAQARALAQSVAGGRLASLLATAQAAGSAKVTWAVDPALLANVTALQTCQRSQPQWARAASSWLASLRTATAGQPLFATPYADPDAAALIGAGYSADVQRSFQYGRTLLNQTLSRAGTVADIAWSPDSAVSYGTLENLSAVDGVRTALLSSSVLPGSRATVLQTPDGAGGYVTVLLASQQLTSLLASASDTPGSAFAAGQDFLAQTALLASQRPGQPIVIAPPERWQPPGGLAADLLSATTTAPWLQTTALTSLASADAEPAMLPSTPAAASSASTTMLARLSAADEQMSELQAMMAKPGIAQYLAVSTVESSAYMGKNNATALAMIRSLASSIAAQQQGVHIVAEDRVTLGGLKGSVPVSIDNRLGYPVEVRLLLQYSQASDVTVTPDPAGVITVPARTAQAVRLSINAGGVGSTAITMSLADKTGRPIPGQLAHRITVQATQVGMLGIIIFAAALGLFLLASAARAARRGVPGGRSAPPASSGAGQAEAGQAEAGPPEAGPPEAGDPDGGLSAQEPDTVRTEHPPLGAVGPPRPR